MFKNAFFLTKSSFKPRPRLTSSPRLTLRCFSGTSGSEIHVDPSSLRLNYLNAGLHMIPHPAKKHKGGEDAACITERIIALADGVGGWSESGIDPAKYSRQLCSNIDRRIA